MPDQTGRTVLVTGANSGLGLRTAEALAAHGARVLLACRNVGKGEAARAGVQAKATGPDPELVRLDLSDQASVAAAAAEVTARVDHLDVLMNNAGIMAVPLARNAEGWEMQFATNHLGHYALTARLLPRLLAASEPRVVTTSSTAARMGSIAFDDLQWDRRRYSKWRAYGQTKLANLLFAFELGRRAAAAGTTLVSAAAHPGYANTHLQAAGPELAGNRFMEKAVGITNRFFAQSDADGALPQLYAATMPDVRSGEYFGPSGFMEQQGPPKRVTASKAANDEAAAARLWDESARLTGVTFDFG